MPLGRIALCSVKGIIKIVEYEKEVTGNGYIDLTDAVVNKLLELKAYGGCTQASTPTPSTPVDIVCNNGALKVKDKELPVGYKRITSISFDGGTYYNTNENLYGSDTISMKLDQSGSGGRNIFGAYSGTTAGSINYSFYGYNTATGQAYLRYGDSLYRPIIGTGIRTLTYGPGTTTGFATNVTITADTFESADTAYIGALPNSSSPKYEGEFIGNIEVSNSNGTRLKWIPCKRKSDGVIGYYEVVNGNFLEPSGNGTPTAGDEDYSNIEVYVDGTKEKINAHGKNLFDRDTVDQNFVSGKIKNNNGEEINDATSTYSTTYIKVSPSTSYTFSWIGGSAVIQRIYYYTENKQWISRTQSTFGQSPAIFTTPNNCEYIQIQRQTSVYVAATNIQLELGSTATTYEPYFNGGTATCEDLLGVGDYLDEQEILSGNVITKVGVIVLTGEESWNLAGSGDALRVDIRTDIGLPPTQDLTSPMMCTHYPFDAYFSTGGSTQPGTFNAWNGTEGYFLRFSIVGMNITTVNQWKSWLAAQATAGTPVIVVYPLATPTTLSVAGQSLSIPAGNSRIEIVEGSILDLPLYAKYKSTSE